jgi:hypothetical protein
VKKWFLLFALILIVFIAYNRTRIYLRDPLASVTHNGVREDGVQVYINFPSDVLLENDNPPTYALIVQHANHVGTPAVLHCLHWLVCMTDADTATLIDPRTDITVASMSTGSVHFHDAKSETVVTLH